MAFPTINIKVTNTKVADEIKELLEQKLHSLEKFLGNETDVKCDAEFEKIAPHEKGRIYRVETNLYVRGVMHRAEATRESFAEAIDEIRDELDKELRRRNKRANTLVRKGGRRIKEMMQLGKV
jgi:ribosomal subunit interface protein